ncbi:MAG: low molecular weight protein arginine phosphatase [Clostridiales bacterium]|nr:low molecular weight protein arginine phosphatase [Clostridiales bacterium]
MHILFICTGNTCRSPMAEALCRDLAKKQHLSITCESAGVFASSGARPAENAIIAMEERGIHLHHHRSQPVTLPLLEKADIILAMTQNHADNLSDQYPQFQGKTYVFSAPVNDPFGGNLATYKKSADQIELLLKEFFIENSFD